MKHRRSVMTIVAICGLTGSVLAQNQPERPRRPDTQPSDQPRKETTRSETETRETRNTYPLLPSTRLEGATVIGADDVRLGTVKDTIVRGNSGRAVYLLVSRGMTPAYAQAPERVVAIPFAAFQWDEEKRTMTVPTTEVKFNAAPSMELDKWNTLREPTLATNVYKYYEVPEDRAEADRRIYRVKRERMEDADKRDRREEKDARDRANDRKDDKINDRKDDKIKDKPDATPRRDPPDDKTLTRIDAEGSLFRVSEVRNKALLDHDGKEVGLLNDIVFDAPSGHVAFMVITPAANMNAGEGRIGVPWPMFEVDQTGRLYALDLDKDALRAAPRLVQNDWGELKIENYNDDMYKRYGYPAPQWERTTVKTTTSTTTTTRTNTPGATPRTDAPRTTTEAPKATEPGAPRTDPKSDPTAMQSDWRGPYTRAMASGTPRTVKGKVESITEVGTDPKIVVINVRTDEGEVIPVHLAPRGWLDQQSYKVKQGETVTVAGKDITLEGKKCTCARELSSGTERIVIYTDK